MSLAYEAALATLRARLAEPEPVANFDELVSRLHKIDGADLPPMTFAHRDRLDPARIDPVSNANFPKPDGGLWLSPPTETGSAWTDYAAREGYTPASLRGAVTQEVRLRPGTSVLVIDSRDHLLDAAATFPGLPVEHEWQQAAPLDFEAVAESFDAIWVTDAGRRENHRDPSGLDLYAWDIESVVVLNASAVQTT